MPPATDRYAPDAAASSAADPATAAAIAATDPSSAAPRPGRSRRSRSRRRLVVFLAVIGVAYSALWVVRLTRDIVPVASRRFLAGGPLVIAHRGASAVETEHTIAGYRRALADGADVLELDVHLARDGAIVVSHD
ncbi:MAG TPA: glycerophosphodiester phosphodiesterase family protein, partial [Kofleriaceae bacterium]|nr:glycerophosphodiester phosphodiesterase family protein [Kofleriaceae bacterium]